MKKKCKVQKHKIAFILAFVEACFFYYSQTKLDFSLSNCDFRCIKWKTTVPTIPFLIPTLETIKAFEIETLRKTLPSKAKGEQEYLIESSILNNELHFFCISVEFNIQAEDFMREFCFSL